jgi:hypothetical protein
MVTTSRRAIQSSLQLAVGGFCVLLIFGSFSKGVEAAVLPLGPEQVQWSDMAFPSGVTGNFNAGTKTLTLGASPSNDLEIGAQFGPGNLGTRPQTLPCNGQIDTSELTDIFDYRRRLKYGCEAATD